jgi:type IV secretion system protein VirB10
MSDEMESEQDRTGAIDGERVPSDGWVRGERAISSVSRARSLQSRVSSVFASALTILLGVGALTWYYANAFTRPNRARDSAQAAAARRAQGEMPLPSLGRIDAPRPAAAAETGVAAASTTATQSVVAVTVPPTSTAASPGASAPSPGAAAPLAADATAQRLLPAITAKPMDRRPIPVARPSGTGSTAAPDPRLAGPVFVRQSADPSPGVRQPDDPSAAAHAPDAQGLAELLRPTPVVAVQARVLPTRRFLLPKGSFIDCTLETAIDSTLPGMTTCVVATDTFSADGSVVLLERGTRLIGETRGQVQQGTSRIFVLWTEARTPTGVVVPLDSPGTDELGRSGLSGTVDRHFWERFGSAILITAIDGAVQAAAQPSGGSAGAVIYNPSGSQEVLTEVLKSTLNIPPTVKKSQGDRIEILVARDVDFRSVYELRR